MHQMLKFSLRCWKHRNVMIHGSTRTEKQQQALTKVRERIKSIYADPPELAPHFPSILAVPHSRHIYVLCGDILGPKQRSAPSHKRRKMPIVVQSRHRFEQCETNCIIRRQIADHCRKRNSAKSKQNDHRANQNDACQYSLVNVCWMT